MKIVEYTAVIVGASVIAGAALAGPCDNARKGTYEHNVCWLVEERFDEMTPKTTAFLLQALPMIEAFGGIDAMTNADFKISTDLTTVESLDREKCTVTSDTLGERNTVRFNEVDPERIAWEENEMVGVVKYSLRGEAISLDGRREVVFFSLDTTLNEWARATKNLFNEYCDGLESEY